MISHDSPEALSLILVGGGHAHALFIKKFAMNPWKGVRLTLISPDYKTPYSGMLPALIAGVYEPSEAFIDLYKLCEYAQVRFIKDEAIEIDATKKLIYLRSRPPLSWDAISVNVGSQPEFPARPGFRDFAIGVKPVAPFLQRLNQATDLTDSKKEKTTDLVILGGGVAGVEVALNISARLRKAGTEQRFRLTVVHRESEPASELGPKASSMLTRHLNRQGIGFIHGRTPSKLSRNCLEFESGETLDCDLCILCTSASADLWLKRSDLPVDDKGFLLVESDLQVPGHPGIFGAGDCIRIQGINLAKSGVYAVRQAAPLFENIRRFLSGLETRPVRLQKHFLKLVGTGNGSAIAAKGGYAIQGKGLWYLKERIDRTFMNRLNPQFPMTSVPGWRKCLKPDQGLVSARVSRLESQGNFRCLGCGAKWDGQFLSRLFEGLRSWLALKAPEYKSNLDIIADDAVVMDLPPGTRLVQTVDYMPALNKDFVVFGRILVNHCLNDLYAMGARPYTVQLILNAPYSDSRLARDDAFHLIWGILTQLNELGFARLVGGHTAQSPVFSAGLLCNGLARGSHLWSKSGARPGDRLIITKPLGTGVLFAGAMKMRMGPEFPESALTCMLTGHEAAARYAESFDIKCATDITGFGLGGHLMELGVASGVGLKLYKKAIPCLLGTQDLLDQGYRSSLHEQNKEHGRQFWEEPDIPEIFWDPQTSGPLVFSVPEKVASDFLEGLRKKGYPQAVIIGQVCEKTEKVAGFVIAD